MLLKKANILHMLHRVVDLTKCTDIVLVGSGALILGGKHLPASVMMTEEADVYARDADDPEMTENQIEFVLGYGSEFHKEFNYYVDAVSPQSAVLPIGWETRAVQIKLPPENIATVTCISPADLAASKIVAWREKDREWLETVLKSSFVKRTDLAQRIAELPRESLERLSLKSEDTLKRLDFIAPPPKKAN